MKQELTDLAKGYIADSPSWDYFPGDVINCLNDTIDESSEAEYSIFENKADLSGLTRDERIAAITEALEFLNLEVNVSSYL